LTAEQQEDKKSRLNYRSGAALFIVIFAVVISFGPSPEAGDLYRFVDEEGVTYYTNIPGQGREKVPLPLKDLGPKTSFLSFQNGQGIINKKALPSRENGNPERPWIAGHVWNDEKRYDPVIKAASHRFAVDPDLIRAVIKAESNFNHRAVSPKGAMGLMQLMPETAREMAVGNPFDPVENIYAGVRYLGSLLQRLEGSLPLALAAYNAGPERVILQNGIPEIEETRNYIQRVMMYYQNLKRKPAIQIKNDVKSRHSGENRSPGYL